MRVDSPGNTIGGDQAGVELPTVRLRVHGRFRPRAAGVLAHVGTIGPVKK